MTTADFTADELATLARFDATPAAPESWGGVEEAKANLGLATTRELLDELTARINIDYYAGGGGLDYTTVAGRPAAAAIRAALGADL